MQKKLIALAVAGLAAAPAFAQSNVTIYGSADAGFMYGRSGDARFEGLANGVLAGNRLGFKGSEELGNGLKAVFQLEQGYNIGNGAENNATQAFQRQAYVGVQGGFGTLSLGRQYAPGWAYTAEYDALLGTIVSPQSILSLTGGDTITPNSPARWNNSTRFQSANYSGFSGEAIYSFNDAQTNAAGQLTKDDKYGLGLKYANGPVSVGYVFQYIKSASGAVDTQRQKEQYIGASYDFGVVKLVGSWQKKDVSLDSPVASSTAHDNKLYNVGVIVPVSTAGNVLLSYGKLIQKDVNDADAKAATLAYTHALSKRTTGYVAYSWIKSDANANPSLGAPAVALPDETANAVAVGINHKF